MEATPDPTPVEIRELCWEIQVTWTDAEKLKRGAWAYEQEVVEFPTAKVVELLETGGTAAD